VNTIIVAHIIKKNVVSHLANQFFGVDLEQTAWTNCLQTQNCNETSGRPPRPGRFQFATFGAI
jgi:hypothetical protein